MSNLRSFKEPSFKPSEHNAGRPPKNIRLMKIYAIIPFLLLPVFVSGCSNNHHEKLKPSHTDSLNYDKIYGLTLQGEVPKVLNVLDTLHLTTTKDSLFKARFKKRFEYKTDQTNFLMQKDAVLRPILEIFRPYWRKGLLHPNNNYDETLKANLVAFFRKKNNEASFTSESISDSTLDSVLDDYIKSLGLHSTSGLGKVGKFYDLLVWKTMEPKTYKVDLIDDTVSVDIYFMKDFISLGWEAYATFGEIHPGGWTTDEALYAVAKSYDLTSEKFRIHFLKHEGQHFSDMEYFPKLSGKDLEYRAKLAEIYYYEEGLYNLIAKFILRAKYDPERSHPFANYCVIRGMSQVLFDKDYVDDISKWKAVSPEDIHKTAKQIYLKNTKQLNRIGKEVVHYLGEYAKCGDYDL